MEQRPALPEANVALDAWPQLECTRITLLTSGHINRTFVVDTTSGKFILQWLNPIFDAVIHRDIEAITRHLVQKGLVTPLLQRTASDALFAQNDMGIWRLFDAIAGQTILSADSPTRCAEAGRFLGRFHAALADFSIPFCNPRAGVHDTPRYLARLRHSVETHSGHKNHATVARLAESIAEQATTLTLEPTLPLRVVHGDPKISNILFDHAGEAVCLVDLDTLARMPIIWELGDAFRSWCAPLGEEVDAPFDIHFFSAGIAGYAETMGEELSFAEIEGIVSGIEQIALELAARFATDALEESYFGWDPNRYSSSSAHNLRRAEAQFFLAQSIAMQRHELDTRCLAAFGR